MKNKLESENKMNDQIIQKKKREYQKRETITDRSLDGQQLQSGYNKTNTVLSLQCKKLSK